MQKRRFCCDDVALSQRRGWAGSGQRDGHREIINRGTLGCWTLSQKHNDKKATFASCRGLKLCFLSVKPRNLREGWQQSLSGYWRFLSNVLWIEFEWICTCVRVFVFLNRLKPFCSLWQKRKGLGPTPQLHLTNGHLQYPTKPCNTLRVLRGIV